MAKVAEVTDSRMTRSTLEIWKELQQLSLRFRREDYARRYALQRMWLVIPLGIAFFIASVMCAVGVTKFVTAVVPEKPMPTWVLWSTFMFAFLVLFGAAVTQAYVLFAWLERAAGRQAMAPKPAVAGIVDNSVSRTHNTPTFIAVTVFVVVPAVMFGSAFPSSVVLIGFGGLVGILFYMVAN
jgi:hypothetical protein